MKNVFCVLSIFLSLVLLTGCENLKGILDFNITHNKNLDEISINSGDKIDDIDVENENLNSTSHSGKTDDLIDVNSDNESVENLQEEDSGEVEDEIPEIIIEIPMPNF